jgi:hypothetical protein
MDEARAVLDARRYEDPPGQGRLFVEPGNRGTQAEQPSQAAGGGGAEPPTAGGGRAAGRPKRQYNRRVNGAATADENGARPLGDTTGSAASEITPEPATDLG